MLAVPPKTMTLTMTFQCQDDPKWTKQYQQLIWSYHTCVYSEKQIFLLTGREGSILLNLSRFIPIHEIYDKLEKMRHNILLFVYCLAGCDTVNSFWGYGKKTA